MTISSSWSHILALDVVGIILYIYHQVDRMFIHAKMNYVYKVAGAEDLISVVIRRIEEGTCGRL